VGGRCGGRGEPEKERLLGWQALQRARSEDAVRCRSADPALHPSIPPPLPPLSQTAPRPPCSSRTCDGAQALVVPLPRVRRAAADEQLGAVVERPLLQAIVVQEARLR
jgi:hypothetical protein